MIGLVTQLAIDEQNAAAEKAAPMAAGAPPARGVPSAAAGVAGQAEDSAGAPAPLVPPGGLGTAQRTGVLPEGFRRPYITAGHAADSPGNAPVPAEAMRARGGAR